MGNTRFFFLAVLAMCGVVVASNILVLYPVHYAKFDHILTYAAFTYPFAFVVNDVTNRYFGPAMARRVVYAGFFVGLSISWWLATARIAIASASAFLFAQLFDIWVFTSLRHRSWWQAPFFAALIGALFDTLLFFSIAFAPFFHFFDLFSGISDSALPEQVSFFYLTIPVWLSLAFGDLVIKLVMALLMLVPYGLMISFLNRLFLVYGRNS